MTPDLRQMKIAGGFTRILADPAWKFLTYSQAPNTKGPERHYPTMSLSDIMALPVAEIAADDCWLALWATWPMLPQALDVVRAWGFSYSTGGAWAKQSSTGRKWQFGPGYVFRSASEPLIIARRGNPKWLSKSERNLWIAPVREHSRKPECVQEMLDRATAGPGLEMFSRQNRTGWASWGNETGRF